jgi:hypothetical protein
MAIMKMTIRLVLALALVQMALAAGTPKADVSTNPTVDAMSACLKTDGNVSLNVRALSAPDARLKYVELGNLLPQSATTDASSGEGDVPPSSSMNGSVGITSFDGSAITLNVPPAVEYASDAPLRITGVDNSVRGVSQATSTSAYPIAPQHRVYSIVPVIGPPLGGRPAVQPLAHGHYRLEGNKVVRQDQVKARSSTSTSSRSGRGGNRFMHH